MLDKVIEGLSVLGIGMGTVFVVLMLLMVIISLMGLAAKLLVKKPNAKPVTEAPAADIAVTEKKGLDDEFIAVISAALSAYSASENIPANRLVVRSVRRVTNWSKN